MTFQIVYIFSLYTHIYYLEWVTQRRSKFLLILNACLGTKFLVYFNEDIWESRYNQSSAVAVKCATAPATATCSDALHFVKLVAVAVAALLLEVSATATLINDSYVFIGCVT